MIQQVALQVHSINSTNIFSFYYYNINTNAKPTKPLTISPITPQQCFCFSNIHLGNKKRTLTIYRFTFPLFSPYSLLSFFTQTHSYSSPLNMKNSTFKKIKTKIENTPSPKKSQFLLLFEDRRRREHCYLVNFCK